MKILVAVLLVPTLIGAFAGQSLGQESKSAGAQTWYGKQIIVADALALAPFAVGTATAYGPALLVGGGSFLVTPIFIHHAHGNNGRALPSPLMHVDHHPQRRPCHRRSYVRGCEFGNLRLRARQGAVAPPPILGQDAVSGNVEAHAGVRVRQ